MSDQKLVPVTLKKLPPGWHGDGGGLYLVVQESGTRSWILRIVVRGKRRDIGLGALSTKSLAEAREEASNLRSRARKGEDVVEARRIEKRVIPTFKEAATAYHAMISETFDSETHAYNWLQSLELYVFPVFGSKTVDAIESADILKAITPIWTTIPDTARRTLRRVSAVFDRCQADGHRNVMVGNLAVPLPNPCTLAKNGLPDNHAGEKHHESVPFPELPEFIQKLRKNSSNLCVKLGLEFLILTCARTADVLLATWDEINMDAKVWTVPAERMKMKVEHKVPLSDRCIEILNLAKDFNDSKYVFPSKPNKALSNTALLMPMRRMGYTAVPHGFRATFKTWAEETTTFDSLVIEASMAHVVKGIERHYLRTTFFDLRRELLNSWAAFATGKPAAARKRR